MAGELGCHTGGIAGLLDVIDEHREAVEYELIRAGYRLRDIPTEALNWRDLYVMVRQWQAEPGNAFSRSFHGYTLWTTGEQLLAHAVDVLAIGNWQRQQKASAQKPKKIPRPWEKAKDSRRLGSDPIPISQFDDWWDSHD